MRSRRSVMAPPRGWPPLEQMPAARRLGAQIALIVPVRREDMGHPLGDGDAAAVERGHLFRVVGQQADAQEAELTQHFGRRQVDAFVGVEAELFEMLRQLRFLDRKSTRLNSSHT